MYPRLKDELRFKVPQSRRTIALRYFEACCGAFYGFERRSYFVCIMPSLQQKRPLAAATENRTQAVVEQLAELILSGSIQSGSALPAERELARRFGVSRNVLREATKILQSRGLLSIKHGARTTVKGVMSQPVQQAVSCALYGQDDALIQLTEVRLTLEVAIAELAAQRATNEDIAALRDIMRDLEAAVGAATRYAELDVEFHRALAEATHNTIFTLMLDSIAGLLRQSRQLALVHETPATSVLQHQIIFDAVENHDATRAAKAMRRHLELQKTAFEHLLRSP